MTLEPLPEQAVGRKEAPVELDAHVALLAAYNEARKNVDFWEDRLRKIKAQLAKLLGEATEGTVDGEPVLFYEYQNRFRSGDFKKDYPDLYKLYTRDVSVHKFDEDWFKLTRPDLWAAYQSRVMRNSFAVGDE